MRTAEKSESAVHDVSSVAQPRTYQWFLNCEFKKSDLLQGKVAQRANPILSVVFVLFFCVSDRSRVVFFVCREKMFVCVWFLLAVTVG
jgi:hypothetical protein